MSRKPAPIKRETTMIRLETKTNAALNMLVAELKAKYGRHITQSDAVWYLMQHAAKDIAERAEQLVGEQPDGDDA